MLLAHARSSAVPPDELSVVPDRFERSDFVALTEEFSRMMGGGFPTAGAAALYVSLTGRSRVASTRLSSATQWLLAIDTRPRDWNGWGWKQRVWDVTDELLRIAYWCEDSDLATEALQRRWLPGRKRALDWDDVPSAWGERSAEWFGFAFWRHWWVRKLGLRPGEGLDAERVLRHGLHVAASLRIGGPGVDDFFAVAHALLRSHAQGSSFADYGPIGRRLLGLTPEPWRHSRRDR